MTTYYCRHCGAKIKRQSLKAWIKSYCSIIGKTVRIVRVAVCIVGTMLLSGCRTYYVYQYGLGDNEILVDAEVEKEINPTVKASLK